MNNTKLQVTLVFLSPNGTTKTLANMIGESLIDFNVRYIDLGDSQIQNDELQDVIGTTDILGVGTPIYHLTMLHPIRKFLDNLSEVDGSHYGFSFVTYGHVSTGKAISQVCKALHNKGYDILGALKTTAPHFYESLDGYPADDDYDLVEEFVNIIQDRIENNISWDDMNKLLNFQPLKTKIMYHFAQVFARFRVPSIKYDADLCNQCKRCEKVCPVHIIDADNLPEKGDGCFHCYNCVRFCPTGAMHTDLYKLEKLVNLNKRIVSENPVRAMI